MSKGSIKNPLIAIQPAKKLIDFIKTLHDSSIALPENLLHVYQSFTADKKARKIDSQPVAHPQLTADEQELLQKMSTDKSTANLDDFLKNLAFNGIENDDQGGDSTSDLEADAKEKTHNSKNQSRRDRANKKEKDRSKLTLNLNDLRWINQFLSEQREIDGNAGYLHELLEGSKLVLPQNEIVERNPELEARCVRLRREQDERSYKTMTKNVDCSRTHAPDDTISYQGNWTQVECASTARWKKFK